MCIHCSLFYMLNERLVAVVANNCKDSIKNEGWNIKSVFYFVVNRHLPCILHHNCSFHSFYLILWMFFVHFCKTFIIFALLLILYYRI